MYELEEKLIAESYLTDIRQQLNKLTDNTSLEVVKLKEELAKVEEEITAGDWGRIGVIAGMLWYKIDALLNQLSTTNNTLHAIERNTAKIK